VLISTGGGVRPVWRRDGSELYYWKGDELIAAQLEARDGRIPEVRSRSTLFRSASDPIAGYDVSPDGSRFAIVTGAPRANRLVVALDALGDVRQLKRPER
jgi:hypothetical protein